MVGGGGVPQYAINPSTGVLAATGAVTPFAGPVSRRKLRPSTVASYRKYPQSVFAEWLDHPFVGTASDGVATRRAQVTERGGPAQADNARRTPRSIVNSAMVDAYRGRTPIGRRAPRAPIEPFPAIAVLTLCNYSKPP